MNKIKNMIIITIIFILSLSNIYVKANKKNNYLEYSNLIIEEDTSGEVAIPTRDGSYARYTEIYTYEELYSVLEDLSYDYKELLEEVSSLENNIEDLHREIEEKDEEISLLKGEKSGYINSISNESGDWKLLIIPISIFGIPFLISWIIDKIEKIHNERKKQC